MDKTTKIVVTIVIIIVGMAIFVPIAGFASDAGSTVGVLGIAVVAGMWAGIKAVWRKLEDNDDEGSIM